MSDPGSNSNWFQVIVGSATVAGVLSAIFGGLFRFLQKQIDQVKKDAEASDAGVKREMLLAMSAVESKVDGLRVALDESERRAAADSAMRETQRLNLVRFLEGLSTKLEDIPKRGEIKGDIAATEMRLTAQVAAIRGG